MMLRVYTYVHLMIKLSQRENGPKMMRICEVDLFQLVLPFQSPHQ